MDAFLGLLVMICGMTLILPVFFFVMSLIHHRKEKKKGIPVLLFTFLAIVVPLLVVLLVPGLKEKLPDFNDFSIGFNLLVLAWYALIFVISLFEWAHADGLTIVQLLRKLYDAFKPTSQPAEVPAMSVTPPAIQEAAVPAVQPAPAPVVDLSQYGDDFVQRCLTPAYTEEEETRRYNSEPAFARLLDPLNNGQYAQAIAVGTEMVAFYPDFDLIYYWLGSAYRSNHQPDHSREVMRIGLEKARRKSRLLVNLGETEWQAGDIHAAVYWWAQASHLPSADDNLYLLLSYVALGLGMRDFNRRLLQKVDSMRGGEVRLNTSTAYRLVTLVETQRSKSLDQVLQGLEAKYFPGG